MAVNTLITNVLKFVFSIANALAAHGAALPHLPGVCSKGPHSDARAPTGGTLDGHIAAAAEQGCAGESLGGHGACIGNFCVIGLIAEMRSEVQREQPDHFEAATGPNQALAV